MSAPFESALRGLALAFPDFVAVDWQTNEVALLQYPRQNMIDINPGMGAKFFAHIKKEIEKVESQYLLRELITRNSATLSAAYLTQLRRLQMQAINGAKMQADNVEGVEVVLYGDDLQRIENQDDDRKTRNLKLKTETKENSLSTREEEIEIPEPTHVWGDSTDTRYETALKTLKSYFEKNPSRRREISDEAKSACDETQFDEELTLWLRRYADDFQITQNPVKALTSGRGCFISWLSQTFCRAKYQTNGNDTSTRRNGRVQQQRKDNSFPSSEELRRKYGVL